jgi:hypothetical protein
VCAQISRFPGDRLSKHPQGFGRLIALTQLNSAADEVIVLRLRHRNQRV